MWPRTFYSSPSSSQPLALLWRCTKCDQSPYFLWLSFHSPAGSHYGPQARPGPACADGSQRANMWPSPSLTQCICECPAQTTLTTAIRCQDAGWQALPSGLVWNGLPLPLSLWSSCRSEFMQHFRNPCTPACWSIGSDYCETALVCAVFVCSVDSWNNLLELNFPKGTDKLIWCAALGTHTSIINSFSPCLTSFFFFFLSGCVFKLMYLLELKKHM